MTWMNSAAPTRRNFRLLLSSSAVSNLGDGVSALAFPWLATLITRDPFLIAMVAFATRLPWLLFAIPAGVITDRLDRRQLMLRADCVRFLLTAGVIGVILSVPAFPPDGNAAAYITALSALAFALGLAEVLRDNAAQTVLPSVVAKDDLERANGQIWSVEQIMGSFVGPPLAGLLIALAVPAPFVLDALTFAIAAALVWAMAIPARPAPVRRSLRVEMAEGWTWMRSHPLILRLAIMLGLMNGANIMVITIMVLFAQETLGLNAAGYGILMTCGAAGGVLAGMIGPKIVARFGRNPTLMVVLAVMPFSFVVLALTSNPYVAGWAEFNTVFTGMLWNVVTVSYRQRVIPDALLGRVNSLYRFFGWGSMPIAAVLAGTIVAWSEPVMGRDLALRVPFITAAVICFGLFIYGARKLRL